MQEVLVCRYTVHVHVHVAALDTCMYMYMYIEPGAISVWVLVQYIKGDRSESTSLDEFSDFWRHTCISE